MDVSWRQGSSLSGVMGPVEAQVWAVVVAAGSGSRFGASKQYAPLGDRRVLDWSLTSARTVSAGVVAVVPPERAREAEEGADLTVAGGPSRSASVRAGLAAVPPEADIVIVHDGARPLAPAALFRSVVGAVVAGADVAVPCVPVTDTLRSRSGAPVDREALLAVQTPQAFRADALRAVHADEPEATDDASLIERAGGKVVVVDGSPTNVKVTHRLDLVVAEALLGAGCLS
jgi:2-C-methyl-D-erythritol 4-phosphate cytidylyltransferase